jgi:hypothetical protein
MAVEMCPQQDQNAIVCEVGGGRLRTMLGEKKYEASAAASVRPREEYSAAVCTGAPERLVVFDGLNRLRCYTNEHGGSVDIQWE